MSTIRFPAPVEWTDQQTGEPIILYSYHHVREWEHQQSIQEMCRQRRIADEPVVVPPYVEPIAVI